MILQREQSLRLRIKFFTGLFILGLVLSGLTALPLEREIHELVKYTGAGRYLDAVASGGDAPAWAIWLLRVHAALRTVDEDHPFLFYGTDWLALQLGTDRVRGSRSLRAGVRRAARHSLVVAAGRQCVWRDRFCAALVLPQVVV